MQPTLYVRFRNSIGTQIGIAYGQAVLTDTGWHIVFIIPSIPIRARSFAIGTDCTAVTASDTVWQISDYRVMQNGQAMYLPLATFNSALTSYSVAQAFVFPLYYLSLFTSMSKSAPKFYAWAAMLLAPLMDMLAMVQQAYQKFALPSTAALLQFAYSAAGPQLDIIGQIVGASRYLPFQPYGPDELNIYMTYQETSTELLVFISNVGSLPIPLVIGQQYTFSDMTNSTWLNGQTCTLTNFTNEGTQGWLLYFTYSGTVIGGPPVPDTGGLATLVGGEFPLSPVLSDSDYLTLIQAKIAQNQWDGEIDSLYALWEKLFPNGGLVYIDNQDMTADIVLVGQFGIIAEQMIVNGLIIPRPQAVQYTYSFPSDLPLFGFDQENATIAGFDVGNWS